MSKHPLYFVFAFVLVYLCACGSQPVKPTKPAGKYDDLFDIIPTAEKDSGPAQSKDMSHVVDAVPRYEKRTIAGNKSPYKVKGIVYHVMDEPKGFKEVGMASWYGNKFHGRNTSNGEVYDMYGMTGAHKSLPIPSYVRVTNLKNNKTIVVRINDRGPFAHGRVIDLSYAGAQKLGYVHAGTAKVVVEYIDFPNQPAPVPSKQKPQPVSHQPIKQQPINQQPIKQAPQASQIPAVGLAPSAATQLDAVNKAKQVKQTPAVQPSTKPQADTQVSAQSTTHASTQANTVLQRYLQVGAFYDEAAALTMQFQVASHIQWPVKVVEGKAADQRQIYRVFIGALPDDATQNILQRSLIALGLPDSHPVMR